MKLISRRIIDCFEEPLQYSELSERWQLGGNLFDYYSFHFPKEKFDLEIVSMLIDSVGPFDCSGPPLWVVDINPIALVKYGENKPLRIYGAREIKRSIEFYRDHHTSIEDSGKVFSGIAKIYSNNEKNTPQATLERLVKVYKPDKYSWEEIIDLIYENITKARDVLLNYAKQVPNESVAKVIGDLELSNNKLYIP